MLYLIKRFKIPETPVGWFPQTITGMTRKFSFLFEGLLNITYKGTSDIWENDQTCVINVFKCWVCVTCVFIPARWRTRRWWSCWGGRFVCLSRMPESSWREMISKSDKCPLVLDSRVDMGLTRALLLDHALHQSYGCCFSPGITSFMGHLVFCHSG